MTLPDEFKFNAEYYPEVYSATLIGGEYVVTWIEKYDNSVHSVTYLASKVARLVANGLWVIRSESFPQLVALAEGHKVLISEKKDASDLAFDESKALLLTRAIITRILNDRG